MNKIEQIREFVKDEYDKVVPEYQKRLDNSFNIEGEVKEKLIGFFNKTNEEVLISALMEYQKKLLNHKEKENFNNINVEIPIIVKPSFTMNEKLFLLSLYINKLVEYDFEGLGLTDISIIKRYMNHRKINENIVYYNKDSNNSYNAYLLKLQFSLIKMCIKDQFYDSHTKNTVLC